LIAAGVIGFGGVAAAGPGGLDPLGLGPDAPPTVESTVPDDTDLAETVPARIVPEETVPEETTPGTTIAEESPDEAEATILVEASDAPVFVDNTLTKFDESTCRPGNHGETVSAVARGEEPFEDVSVRDAAHSDCGKKDREEVVVDDDVDPAEHSEVIESPEADDDDRENEEKARNGKGPHKASSKHEAPGKGGGKGGGKGRNGK